MLVCVIVGIEAPRGLTSEAADVLGVAEDALVELEELVDEVDVDEGVEEEDVELDEVVVDDVEGVEEEDVGVDEGVAEVTGSVA